MIAILENLGARKDSWISQRPVSLGKTLALQNCDRRFNRRENRKVVYMNQSINLKGTCALLLILLVLACFAFIQKAQATDLDSVLPNGNTADGSGVLVSLTSGVWNSGFGFQTLNHDAVGKNNTAMGVRALFSNVSGSNNTANGVYALYSNTTGWYNNAVGAYALSNNTIGNYNTANGYAALYRNTASFNTATGFGALYKNTTGLSNTANGFQALNRNTTGAQNTANGVDALVSNTNGNGNTANGIDALSHNTIGGFNTANGVDALFSNTTGNSNTASGDDALFNNTSGSVNIALGADAGSNVTTADNVICIGTDGANVSNSCFIGHILGATVSSGTAVFINSSGQLGTVSSSRRFKNDIKPMDQGSEAILALKPVTFHYKSDNTGTPQFGLIAEEVAEINPDLVVRDDKGDIYTVRYDAVNAMLLNEFLKEHRKVEEQQVRITEFNSRVAKQEALAAQQQRSFQSKLAEQDKQIEALTSGLEKVSAQLEVTKSAPQVVSSNP
jgi:hypothetical protein